MADQPKYTFQQIHKKYVEDREKIKALRQQALDVAAPILEEVAKLEKFQKAREDYLIAGEDFEAFEFLTDLYLNGRNDKAEAKKVEENINVDMKKLEDWLLKMLSRVGKSIATKVGTVYKTRKESVRVADFEAYVESEMLRPVAERLHGAIEVELGEISPLAVETLMSLIKENIHLEAIDRSASKSYVLEKMGEQTEDGSRPNTPPAGIDYKAFATIGVRKGK